MPVIKPVNHEPCAVCQNNIMLVQFLKQLDNLKNDIAKLWHKASEQSVCVEGIDKDLYWERTLKDEDLDMTLVPTFNTYDRHWKRTLNHNPFRFDWTSLDCCQPWDRDYVGVVSDALDEQIASWKAPTPFGKMPNLPLLDALEVFDESVKKLEKYLNLIYPIVENHEK
ncbi:hypothetical protein PBPMD00_14 [Pinkberry virus LS07-2018-MD00]|nr:hypothetical protein PBPMD00_14 [Pinkberry virus LS07-2018-MD00]